MPLRSYTAMRVRQAAGERLNPTPRHAFVVNERMPAALRFKCKDCGHHVLQQKYHERLTQAQLDAIAPGLRYMENG